MRQTLLVGPDGAWRRELWLDGMLETATAGDGGAEAPGAELRAGSGYAPTATAAADEGPGLGATDTTAGAGSGTPPRAGSAAATVRARAPGSPKGSPVPLDPNRAPPDSLQLLPGVGPVMAGRIVAAREQGTVFRQPEDLLAIKGIGPATLARLAPFLRFPGGDCADPAEDVSADNRH